MKFTLPTPQPLPDIDTSLRVGNVYACKGGGKTRYWIVVGLDDVSVNMLGINADVKVTSTGNYGVHVFNGKFAGFTGRALLGRCEGIENLDLDVTWYGEEA